VRDPKRSHLTTPFKRGTIGCTNEATPEVDGDRVIARLRYRSDV